MTQGLYGWPPSEAITSPGELAKALSGEFEGETREKVIIAVMDNANRILHRQMVSYGSATGCMFPFREIIYATLIVDGVGFALAHNHPSGNPSFSAQDVESTRRIKKAANTIGLRFIDHLVITGGGQWTSYTETFDPTASWPASKFSVSDCVQAANSDAEQIRVVRIAVDGGVALPAEVPSGVAVEIVDLDESDLPPEDRAELRTSGHMTMQGPYRNEQYLRRMKEAKNDPSI